MFRVVTVSREFGSGGGMIARSVAETLGWTLLHRVLIAEIARAAQVAPETAVRYDEHVDSWWHRLNRSGLRSVAIQAGVSPGDAQFFDAQIMAAFAHRVMLKAAVTGACVIVGRGAQCALQEREDVLHTFIYAPWVERVRRVRTRTEVTENVEDLIRATDQERAGYVKTYYGCDWKDPHLYDMMLSSKLGTERAASIIVNTVLGGGHA
jgi:cytidylate kinase